MLLIFLMRKVRITFRLELNSIVFLVVQLFVRAGVFAAIALGVVDGWPSHW